jgi:1-deoxy-D-xylulose-5-phosphate reductoisomerase
VAASPDTLSVVALSAHSNLDLLLQQATNHHPQWVVATDASAAAQFDWSSLPAGCQMLTGPEALTRIVAQPEVETVVAAIVGSAGLHSTLAALEAGKTVALANKETLVMSGPLVMELAKSTGATLLPVDSEHSAVHQALRAGRREEVRRVVLTASGGPFRNHTLDELADVTVQDALDHPTWDMGPKITVDSATMMNKALEIIEARWLFDLCPHDIQVMIHPQSVVHSLVEFTDGSVIAQLSPPDMKLPIQYALNWPERRPGVSERLDWSEILRLDFEPADLDRFDALRLGVEAASAGGTMGAVLNATNEAAVAGFLEGKIRFADIVPACRAVLENHDYDPEPSLERLIELDRWSREEVLRWVCT